MTQRDQAGFALVELLVVLALLGFLGLLAGGGLTFGTRVWERTQDSAERETQRRQALADLRRLIEAARPVRDPETNALRHLTGDGRGIAFEVPGGTAVAGHRPARVVLTLKPHGPATSIELLVDDGRSQTARTLLREEGELKFDFQDEGDEQWRHEWREGEAPPARIRLAAETSRFPPFVARLPVRTDPLCAFDLALMECRS